jgi:serine/threonine protein kinase
MSPQVCKNVPYSKKTDVYSMGVVFFRLMTYEYPFYAGNNTTLKLKIIAGESPQIKSNYCDDLKMIVKSML